MSEGAALHTVVEFVIRIFPNKGMKSLIAFQLIAVCARTQLRFVLPNLGRIERLFFGH